MNRFAKPLFALVAMFMLVACGFEDPDDTTAPSQDEGKTEEEQVLTIANPADITTTDPQNNSVITTAAVLVNVYGKLLNRDAEGKIIPELATEWGKKDDLTWSFTLREGVTFHNGDPFTAEDVKFSIERVATDESLQEHSVFSGIESVEIVDETHVNIITKQPDPVLLSRLAGASASILPAAYFEEVGSDAFFEAPAGTGAYTFDEWNRGSGVTLGKFDDYYDGEPTWDTVHFQVVPENSTRVSELLTGGIDIAFNIPTADFERIESNEGTHVAVSPIQRVIQLWLSTQEGEPTADPAVRKAIDLAIDNQVIIDEILAGAATATRTHISPGNFGADESLYDTYEYDPDQAKQILADAGYEGGVTVDISVNNYYTEMAEVVQGMLADVGITANLELIEQSQFAERLFSEDLDEGVFVGWGNTLFDASVLELFKEENVTSYSNPEVEELLEAAAYNMNEEERAAQYKQVQQILSEDRGALYLFQLEGRYGVSDAVKYEPRLDELYYVNEIMPANQ
ncbi:ABC transporter substrate-binding protein [Aureibacillus halotolerans]|uniref:Peptide/nickel transport system substrate-binding protein n=1 Tax=Aureibacillus halotolerans TaxID=1508390 RepID=A0A4R6TW62_9BACI|nr:ABC transporter substrate-binding protein [Aureibacillus halotolerans]TDQ37681.1 peptide/nickel transport system substrate-binding protein [Aureibacillus halotolerans]